MLGEKTHTVGHLLALNPAGAAHGVPLQELWRHLCRAAHLFQPLPGFRVYLLRLERTPVTLLGREEFMGLWHIDTLDFGNIQHRKSASARIAVLGFLPDSGFLPSRTGSRAAAPACVIGFCRHFFTSSFEKNEQPQTAALNYPFENAFFAHETPRPFPRGRAVEILTAPGFALH